MIMHLVVFSLSSSVLNSVVLLKHRTVSKLDNLAHICTAHLKLHT